MKIMRKSAFTYCNFGRCDHDHMNFFVIFYIILITCFFPSPSHSLKYEKIKVETFSSTFRDSLNRTRLFHGMNYVQKSPPYYPTIYKDDIEHLVNMGMNVVRLGCMLPGLFPTNSTPSELYLKQINNISQLLFQHNIYTIIDLHQDVLAPKLCGEGTPDWMLNVSSLGAMPMPEPLAWHDKNFSHKHCHPLGWFKFLGWSEWYLTDAVGKAFQDIYHGKGLMSKMFDQYWHVVSNYFNNIDSVLAYELMNEPWIGDYIQHPDLLLKAGAAEKLNVGLYMQRTHDIVREHDKHTPVLFSPAELNNRAFRRVGYEKGFLPGEPLAFHVYCLVGTDGDGPDTPFQIELCKLDDNFTLSQRNDDLLRLQTAGIVTEFGAVNGVPTGLNEVRRVANAMDAMTPPISWCFWDHNEPRTEIYKKELSRSYAIATPGLLLSQSFNVTTSKFQCSFILQSAQPNDSNILELFLSKKYYYPNGFTMSTMPEKIGTIVSIENDSYVKIRVSQNNNNKKGRISNSMNLNQVNIIINKK